jgi:hypothetical protein
MPLDAMDYPTINQSKEISNTTPAATFIVYETSSTVGVKICQSK